MGLITKEVGVKLNGMNIKYYEEKGYPIPRIKNKWNRLTIPQNTIIKVKVKDLPKGSCEKVDYVCDCCGKEIKNIKWQNYLRYTKENGKYYCNDCAMKLYGTENSRKSRLKNSISFEGWCIENNRQDILNRWDYEINIDKYGNKITPKDISFKSSGFNKKGYWFKCANYPKHKSELKSIDSFVSGQKGSIECNQCNTFGVHYPNLIIFYKNPDDAYKYTPYYGNLIPGICPICKYEKNIRNVDLIRYGFTCPKCGDKIPYSEKFMLNVLEQLNINFITQLSKTIFKWCGKYKYDFYIDKINGIIETHGDQHYNKTIYFYNTLEEIQENDKIKKELAEQNGIKEDKYIAIDCRYSTLEWIKNSIMKRDSNNPNKQCLAEILNFKEEDIDWLKCHEYACNSLVKEVCNLWNSGVKSIKEISKIIKISTCTVRRYIKQGVILGWCIYNAKEKSVKNIELIKKINSIKIICLNTEEIFDSMQIASIKYNVSYACISACCRGKAKSAGKHPITGEKLIWMYYEKYIEDQNKSA